MSAALTQISKVTTGFVPIGGIEFILVIVPEKILMHTLLQRILRQGELIILPA